MNRSKRDRLKAVVPCGLRPGGRAGRSLEQKIRVLVRRYRAAQRRREQSEAAGSKRCLSETALPRPAVLVPEGHPRIAQRFNAGFSG
ncbi:MAG TPA: hypothetical protein VN829_13320, partial [Dongiaceae bacterium]|nr:hypothetical protein [Dongiaceae bacterium]